MKASRHQFRTLCSIFHKHMLYSDNIITKLEQSIKISSLLLVFYRIPNEGIRLTIARNCEMIRNSNLNETLDYILAAGVDDGTILILKTNENFTPFFKFKVCDVLAAVDNVCPKYFNEIFSIQV